MQILKYLKIKYLSFILQQKLLFLAHLRQCRWGVELSLSRKNWCHVTKELQRVKDTLWHFSQTKTGQYAQWSIYSIGNRSHFKVEISQDYFQVFYHLGNQGGRAIRAQSVQPTAMSTYVFRLHDVAALPQRGDRVSLEAQHDARQRPGLAVASASVRRYLEFDAIWYAYVPCVTLERLEIEDKYKLYLLQIKNLKFYNT